MHLVVARTALRIAQHAIGLGDVVESPIVARLQVVGVKPLCEQAVDAVHRFGLGARADLQRLVVVDRWIDVHAAEVCKGWTLGATPAAAPYRTAARRKLQPR